MDAATIKLPEEEAPMDLSRVVANNQLAIEQLNTTLKDVVRCLQKLGGPAPAVSPATQPAFLRDSHAVLRNPMQLSE